MRNLMIFAPLVLLPSSPVARADGPTTVPAGDAYSLSPIRVEQLKSSNYLYISSQATYADVGNVIGKSMGQISKDMASLGLSGIAGAPVIVYRGQTMDPSMPF